MLDDRFLHVDWGSFQPAEAFNCFLVLSCIFFCVAAYGTCSVNEMQNPPEYDACAASGNNYNLGFSDTIVRDTSFHCGAPTTHYSFESVCPNSHLFGFPSTLSGFSYKEENPKETCTENSGSQFNGPFCVELTQDGRQAGNESWSSDYGMFKLINGKVFSCSFNSKGINDLSSCQTEGANKGDLSSCGGCSLWQGTIHSWPKNSEVLESSSIDGSFSPSIRISPAILDWGHKYLYSPLVVFLTVSNTCNNNILHLYEPFSTDSQLYPCNFSTNSLGPSESALICFVFFPKRLGLSSAHLILQTSSGGFLVEAKGYATESPVGIQSLLGLKISPGGKLSKNFSLFNPFDETLYVEEITALGHNFVETEAICGIKNFQVLDDLFLSTIKDRLVVKRDQGGSPIVAIRPHKNWEISPRTSETLIEIDISAGFEGKTFGAFCLHLEWSSQDKSDIVMVPVEAEVDINSASEKVGIFVSATLEGISACDGGETVIIISVRNDASYVSRFVKVIEVAETEIFHVKYTEGLLLFPSFITQVAVIYCSNLHSGLHDLPPEKSNLEENCKLLVLTNDSTSPQIEIPCAGILYMCFGLQKLSSVGLEKKSRYSESGNISGGYVGSTMQLSPKVVETSEIDELVLGNWVSHGTTSGISVLEDHEVLFPTIQVGSYVSRWITVKNPSQHQVIMQLVLNLGEIIDECRRPDDLIRPSPSNSLVLDESITPIRYGFSVPEGALT
ncbi:hypothetical protein L6164_027805 [Bauhinia variegata]|uniref:Uncharacterized protein n=1 Tax=Bauhinia variegata TaxID=167791 RepID=A0ACB9LVU3_BAUVA|nr:hypothetical protein L6164_027805 [Bauhinia variegata]